MKRQLARIATTAALITGSSGCGPGPEVEARQHLEALASCFEAGLNEEEDLNFDKLEEVTTETETPDGMTAEHATILCNLDFDDLSDDAQEIVITTTGNRLENETVDLATRALIPWVNQEALGRRYLQNVRQIFEDAAAALADDDAGETPDAGS